jgi:MFS family permease
MDKVSDSHMFRAFRSRNYSLYFAGRSVSQFGTYMQRTAVVWVIYVMKDSAFFATLAFFAETLPSCIFAIPGGVVADRYNRYKIIKITQILSMIQSVLLAVLVYTHHAPLWSLLTLSILLGIINAFDVPARQSLVHEVVADPADLPNGLALTTAMASLAQLAGPALAGIVLSIYGSAVCFLINAASFGGVFASIVFMRDVKYVQKKRDKKVWTEFKESFAYIRKEKSIGTMILLLALMSLLVMPYSTIMPVFAKHVFKGNATTYGYINSCIGIGAVIGTVFIATRKPGRHLKKSLFVATIILGIGMICFALSRNFGLAMCFAACTGYGSIMQFTVSNIVIQSESDPALRGRVIGILLMAMFGMMPLGSLLVGAISERIGAPATVLGQGVITLIIAGIFFRFLTRKQKAIDMVDAPTIQTEEEMIEEV